MQKLKQHPELLFEIIPSSKQSASNRLREKLRENQKEIKQAFLARHNLENSQSPGSSCGKYRPST